jgi:hypothetical protein
MAERVGCHKPAVIFNISTNSPTANNTYVYPIVLNDGTTIVFKYGLR